MYYKKSHKYESRRDFFEARINLLKKEINQLSKNEILNIDENSYINYLEDKYSLEPLCIYRDNEIIHEPTPISKEVENPYDSARYGIYGHKMIYEGYRIEVSYPFSGDAILFNVRPNSFTIGGAYAELMVNELNNTLSLVFEVWDQNAEQFIHNKQSAFEHQVLHYLSINPEVLDFNSQIRQQAQLEFKHAKDKCLAENKFFHAINVQPCVDTPVKITVPTIQKKRTPKPNVGSRKYETYPSMSNEMYEDIIAEIYKCGQSIERKPLLYIGKDEESLRDMFLLRLECRYDNVTATGETFNYGGKTDICLKDATSGANLFIAECKFWHGAKAMHNAIDQLFERYLTVRDTKVALIFFVKGENFTSVIDSIKKELPTHKLFVRNSGERAESSFSYIFHLPTDDAKPIYLEVMIFHLPKLKED